MVMIEVVGLRWAVWSKKVAKEEGEQRTTVIAQNMHGKEIRSDNESDARVVSNIPWS